MSLNARMLYFFVGSGSLIRPLIWLVFLYVCVCVRANEYIFVRRQSKPMMQSSTNDDSMFRLVSLYIIISTKYFYVMSIFFLGRESQKMYK